MGLRGYHPHRREKAAADIEAMIRQQGLWGRRLPGEREMAEALGISRGTLQKALEELEARGTVLRRHGSGTFAADKNSPGAGARRGAARLAVIAKDSWRPDPSGAWTYYGDMIEGAFRGCRRFGAEGVLVRQESVWAGGPGPEWAGLKAFGGFLLVQDSDPALIRMLLRMRRGPVVLLDSVFRDLPAIGVVDGSFEGARRAVSYLVNLGHRRIGYIAPGEHPDRPHEKSLGYRAALSEAGIPEDAALVCHPEEAALDRDVEAAVGRMLGLPEPPTALFAGTDSRALPAMRVLEAAGRRVGEDFALVGFGDSASRSGLCDSLTSVRIHTHRMGEAAVRAALDAPKVPQARTVIIPDRLIVRDSVCRHELAADLVAGR
ncbi:MAG TPA: GntR family transcriptional regulator [Planctomycetota bacterium]|nr:GntR family transcriptional regulator [Planctomycetota bacterium]